MLDKRKNKEYNKLRKRKGGKAMFIITLIFYLMDVKSYGIDFVNANCSLCERIGRWFVMCGWLEFLLISCILLHIK